MPLLFVAVGKTMGTIVLRRSIVPIDFPPRRAGSPNRELGGFWASLRGGLVFRRKTATIADRGGLRSGAGGWSRWRVCGFVGIATGGGSNTGGTPMPLGEDGDSGDLRKNLRRGELALV